MPAASIAAAAAARSLRWLRRWDAQNNRFRLKVRWICHTDRPPPMNALYSSHVLRCTAGLRFGLRPRSGSGKTMRGARRRRFLRWDAVGDDDVLAGDVLAAGLAMMFRLRSGLRGSQSRMARPTPSQPLREQGKMWAGPQPSQGISNIGRSTPSQPGRFTTPGHARRTTGVTGGFLDAPKEFCLALAAVQHTSLSHAASTQLRTRHFLLRLEQLHKSENRTLAKTDRRLEQLHRIALSI